jgi:hypothetical protein
MQIRGLLIALLVLAGLSGLLWWSNHRPEGDPTKVSDANRAQLMTQVLADITEVTVTRKGEAPLRLRRNADNKWDMVLDPPLSTNSQAAAEVVNFVATVSADQVIEEAATDLAQFGLDPGQFILTSKDRKGSTQQLIVGENTPIGAKYYARRPQEKKVYAIPEYFVMGFNKSVNDLRDKRLVILNDPTLSRLQFKRGSDVLEFTRTRDSLWKMQKPQPFRTDATVVDGLLGKVKELKFDPTLSEEGLKKNQASFASATALASLVLDDGGAPKQLELRKTKSGDLLGQSSSIKGVFLLPADTAAAFEKSLDDFRNRKLMDFGFDDPQRVQIDSGGKSYLLERKGEDWIWNGVKADPATAGSLVNSLRLFPALSFVEKKFTSPNLTVTLLQKDGKTVEKLEISKAQNFYYARRSGEAGEYEIDPKTVSDLEAALAQVKPAGSAKK